MKLFFKKEKREYGLRWVLFWLALLLTGMLTGCSKTGIDRYERVDTAMGTVITETVYVRRGSPDITGMVRDRISDLEEQMLSHRIDTSEVALANGTAGDPGGFTLSSELGDIIDQIQEVSRESGGAFDITLGQTVRLWDIDRMASDAGADVTLPSEAEIRSSLESAGYDKLELNDNTLYLPEGMRLDLGAVGKGIACNEVLKLLQKQPEVTGAVIAVGGSILTYGEKPDGTAWKVGIVDPDNPAAYIGGLTLRGQWCVSTSGDYERYVEADGVRYHHIIDPDTGFPADAGLGSVTVLSVDGALSDALSTACFVLGVEEAQPLLAKYQAYAVFVDHQGEITLSPGMEAFFSYAQ